MQDDDESTAKEIEKKQWILNFIQDNSQGS